MVTARMGEEQGAVRGHAGEGFPEEVMFELRLGEEERQCGPVQRLRESWVGLTSLTVEPVLQEKAGGGVRRGAMTLLSAP